MSDDVLLADPQWADVTRFLEGRIARGHRVIAPPAFERVTGPLSYPDPSLLPDWAIVHKGQLQDYPASVLGRVAAETTPVFANDVFVVFARRPTFGLRSQRSSVHVTALFERLREMAITISDAPGPPDAAIVAPTVEPKPSLPPEALALITPRIETPVTETLSAGLQARVDALLALRPGARVAKIGITLEAHPNGPAEKADAVVLRVASTLGLEAGLDVADRLSTTDGRLLVIADNARSLGRRLARAAGRVVPEGLGLPDLLAALRATGFRPRRTEGFSLDPWRADGDTPPPAQASGSAGGDILDAAGRDAGPDHAALLLVLATRN